MSEPNQITGCIIVIHLLLPHLEAAPACQDTIRYCQNCHYNPDSDCKVEKVLEAGTSVSQQEAACLAILQSDSNLYAVVHSSRERKCFTYNCEHTHVLTYDDEKPYVTYMKTCDTGCLNSSLEIKRRVRLATTSQGNIILPSYENLEDCVYHLTANNAPYAIYFNGGDSKLCQLSNGCSNDCVLETTDEENDEVVIQHCHEYSVSTPATLTTTKTSTTTKTLTTTSTPTGTTPLTTTMPTTTTTTPANSKISTTTLPTTTTTTPANSKTPTTTMHTATTKTPQTTTTMRTTTIPTQTTTPTAEIMTRTPATRTTTLSTTTIAKSTQNLSTKKPRLFIIPCKCHTSREWANITEDDIVKLLIKDLTIDASNTTLARSKRISRSDTRTSSAAIGRVASLTCIALLCLIVLSDCLRLCRHIRTLKKNKVFPERRVTNSQYDINRLPHIYT